jgi:hypothetical protein
VIIHFPKLIKFYRNSIFVRSQGAAMTSLLQPGALRQLAVARRLPQKHERATDYAGASFSAAVVTMAVKHS